MKNLVIKIVGTAISFAVTRYLIAGFALDNSLSNYLLTAVLFLLVNLIASPVLRLILFPINLITLGLFRWLINVFVLYLFDILYAGITISAYHYSGYSSALVSLPSADLSLFWTLTLSSLIMSLTYTIFTMLFHTD
ncbi:MAG: phage holin family protein [bacterium]